MTTIRSLLIASPALIVGALALVVWTRHDSASATSFVVDSTAEAVDANPGDGICAAAGGLCTLRAAVQEANALPGADTITLQPSAYILSLSGAGEDAGATGDLDIWDDLTIAGSEAGTTVDAGFLSPGDRVFDVLGGRVQLTHLTIRGGGLTTGGGGGIRNQGELGISNSLVTGNSAGQGGGIDNRSTGTAGISNTTISANHADGAGGGIINLGTLYVFDSLVASNHSIFKGGGIFSDAALAIANSTIAGNTADESGGGVVVHFSNTSAAFTNVTVANNLADLDSNGDGRAGGIYANSVSGPVTLRNTILGGNGTCCGAFSIPFPDDCYGTVTSEGYNLIQTTTDCTITNDDATNKKNVPPMLDPLANNGGPTQTLALQAGSPAIDAGNPAGCSDFFGSPLTVDQRGYSRPIDGDQNGSFLCDIGAYEFGAAAPTPTLTASPTPSPTPTPTASPTPTPTPSPSPTVSPTSTSTPTGTPSSTPGPQQRIWGDVDCDGDITTRDNQAELRFVLQQNPLGQTEPCPDIGTAVTVDGTARTWGDEDCDTEVSTRDNQSKLRFVLEQNALSQTEPCPDVGSPVSMSQVGNGRQ